MVDFRKWLLALAVVGLLLEVVAVGSLTCWSMIIVTIPLGVTRAVIASVIPVLVLLTALVTAPPMALEMDPCNVGTVVPTLTLAGMLSVAITEGAERIFALLSDSINVTVPSSSRLLPTIVAAERLVAPLANPPSKVPTVGMDVVPFSACKEAVTSLEKAWVKSME